MVKETINTKLVNEILNHFKETFYVLSHESKMFEISKKFKILFHTYNLRDMIEEFIQHNYPNDCCNILFKGKTSNVNEEIINKALGIYKNNAFIIAMLEYNAIMLKSVNPDVLKDFLKYFKYIILHLPKENTLLFTIQDVVDLYTILRFLNIITEKDIKNGLNLYTSDNLVNLLNEMKNKIIKL